MLLLFIIEALIVGGGFSSRPINWANALRSGYIALDIAFLFCSLLLILMTSSLLLFPPLRARAAAGLELALGKKSWLAGVILTTGLICYEFWQDYLLLRSGLPSQIYYEYRKLLLQKFPGFLLIFLISIQFLLYLLWIKRDLVWAWIRREIPLGKAVCFLGIVLAFFLVNLSNYGFTARETELAAAQTMNAPLLGIQISLVAGSFLIAGRVLGWAVSKWPRIKPLLSAESAAVVGIWVLAIFSWNQSPLEPNYFIDFPRAPNYELYPSSDALKYDIQALDLLDGGGMRPNSLQSGVDFTYHPAHSFFLALLHAISGESYQDVLFPQIVVLSLIPVLLYKLGSLIHTRFSGLVISVLYLVRERNALFLGRRITVSNAKTLMTEPWAILFFLLFLYLLLLWVRSKSHKPWLIILSGGVFGVLVLIRMEVLAMLPVIGLIGLIHFRTELRGWLRAAGWAGISILLIITPWMIRNYQVEGVFGLDKAFYVRWNINRYLDYFFPEQEAEGESILPAGSRTPDLPGTGKNAASIEGNSAGDRTAAYQAEQPASYLLDDFVNSLEQTVYYLPNSHQPLLTLGSPGVFLFSPNESHQNYLEQYVDGLPYWKYDWDGKLAARSYLPLIISLGMIAYGLAQLQQDWKWVPLLFLALILTQSAVYAVLSGSGGRYIAIVDWMPLVFFGIGLSGLIAKGLVPARKGTAEANPHQATSSPPPKKSWYSTAALGGVLLAGLILPLSEILIPARYTEAKLEAQSDLLRERFGIDLPGTTEKGEVLLYGKALYPRFFEAGDRMEDDRKGTIPDYSYQRVEFYLVGSQNGWVTLPVAAAVDSFPHGSEVVIWAEIEKRFISPAGQKVHGRYFQARAIYILPADQPFTDPLPLFCSGEECRSPAER